MGIGNVLFVLMMNDDFADGASPRLISFNKNSKKPSHNPQYIIEALMRMTS